MGLVLENWQSSAQHGGGHGKCCFNYTQTPNNQRDLKEFCVKKVLSRLQLWRAEGKPDRDVVPVGPSLASALGVGHQAAPSYPKPPHPPKQPTTTTTTKKKKEKEKKRGTAPHPHTHPL